MGDLAAGAELASGEGVGGELLDQVAHGGAALGGQELQPLPGLRGDLDAGVVCHTPTLPLVELMERGLMKVADIAWSASSDGVARDAAGEPHRRPRLLGAGRAGNVVRQRAGGQLAA